MRLAAGLGQGWITTEGRAGAAVRRFLQTDAAPVFALSTTDCYRDFLGRAGELGFTDVVAPWPRREGIFAGRQDVLETVAAEVLPAV